MNSYSISVVEPVGKAIQWMLQVLFRPFDAGKWFTIGFCAWLAFFGEQGGGHFNFPGNWGNRGRGGPRNIQAELDRMKDFVVSNLHWIIPLVIFVFVLSLAFMVLFTWLSSRGKFMFLHCVARNRGEVGWPWRQYSRQADNLFVLRVVIAILGCLVFLPVILLGLWIAFHWVMRGRIDPGAVLALIGLGLVLVVACLLFWVVKVILEDFLVPVMFIQRLPWRVAWNEVSQLLSANFGIFLLYLLFQIVIGVVTGMLVLAVVLLTCCIAGCLMMIPYIGTVLLLPILIFRRAYSLYFLAQFGPRFDAFAVQA